MKRFLPLLAAFLLSLPLTACSSAPESPPMSEALKISTFLYPADIESTLDYHTATVKELEALTTSGMTFEPLKVGEERLAAPHGYNDQVGMNFRFEYEGGSVEIISEAKDVQMSVGKGSRIWISENGFSEEHRYGYSMRLANSGYVSLVPLGGAGGFTEMDDISVSSTTIPRYQGKRGNGTEYVITVNAYDGNDLTAPVITAKLLFTHRGKTDRTPYFSDFCSVELISYDYSDAYKIMEAEQ